MTAARMLEKTIVAPVISGYCATAGMFSAATDERRNAVPLIAPNAAPQLIALGFRKTGVLSFAGKNNCRIISVMPARKNWIPKVYAVNSAPRAAFSLTELNLEKADDKPFNKNSITQSR